MLNLFKRGSVMFIAEVKIKGFRNFKDDIIKFNEKSLIIGQNDIGKSNLIYALRILLDRNISESEMEPKISDFYAYEEINDFSIQIKFEGVKEDCVKAKFKGNISDNNELYLSFTARKSGPNNDIEYYFSQGKDEENLSNESNKFESRYYLKTLRIEYVKSNRNLDSFIKKEKKNLLMDMMNERSTEDTNEDSKKVKLVESELSSVNANVRELSYIKNATNAINSDLEKLSTHNKNRIFQFRTITESIDDIQNNVELVSKVNGKELCIGGDGRNNQIFISFWCNKHNNESEKPLSVTIYCIEEPEAHLHPHQQRQLSKFLIGSLNGQVILSTHSPQIASEFDPNSIIRLFSNSNSTKAASNGCSNIIGEATNSFGYRMNIISSEAFFSRVVLLVEGPSEEIFYKTLAHDLNLNLDKNGISIVDVKGVGFNEYMDLLKSLRIKYVFRTDNDIFKIPYKALFRCAGIQRVIAFYKKYYDKNADIDKILMRENEFNTLTKNFLEGDLKKLSLDLIEKFETIGIYISQKDLENDIYDSGIEKNLMEYYSVTTREKVIDRMKNKKAINLYYFLKNNIGILKGLKESFIARPLYKCIEMSNSNE